MSRRQVNYNDFIVNPFAERFVFRSGREALSEFMEGILGQFG